MRRIKIRTPIWNGRKVGVAESKITDDLLIDIIYKVTGGERLYPDTYLLRKGKSYFYPIQVVKGVPLRIIPISSLEVYKK